MLSMHSSLNDMDIADVTVLRPGTVYLLIGHADEKIVVKTEPASVYKGQTVKHNKVAMKAVDSRAGNIKELKDAEVQALQEWADFMERATAQFASDKIQNYQSGSAAQDLKECLKFNKTNVWYKMPAVDITGANKLLEARLGVSSNSPEKGVMRQFADGLNAAGGLEQLGRIIAADLYIGNTDRFVPNGGAKWAVGKVTLKFKALKNPGNLFVIGLKTQQRIGVSGHDFIDPNSGFRNYGMGLSDVTSAYNEAWLGEVLCDSSQRKKFAKDIVNDLELVLTPNRKALSPFRKLERGASKRIEAGMLDGMRLIVKAIDTKYTKGPAPVGVTDRRTMFANALA